MRSFALTVLTSVVLTSAFICRSNPGTPEQLAKHEEEFRVFEQKKANAVNSTVVKQSTIVKVSWNVIFDGANPSDGNYSECTATGHHVGMFEQA